MSKKTEEVNTAVVKKDDAKVPMDPNTMTMFHEDAGAGFENTGMDDYVVPFITILQKMSPVCDEDNQAHLEGAKPGLFFNTATQEMYEELSVVPAAYQRMFAEWIPREDGGGFRGHHQPESPEVAKAQLKRDGKGRFLTDHGTNLVDTRYHFVLLLVNGHVQRAVLALSSTQIKKSRLWMTAMRNIEMEGPEGKKFTPPMYSHIYKLTSVTESNDQGTWKGYKAEIDRPLTVGEVEIYLAAKEFRKEVEAGRVKVDDSQTNETTSSDEDEEVPF